MVIKSICIYRQKFFKKKKKPILKECPTIHNCFLGSQVAERKKKLHKKQPFKNPNITEMESRSEVP